MTKKALTALGLNEKEAEMYIALLKMGDAPIADIVKATGEHPQIVHRMVDRLVAKGLALATTKRHRRYIRAENPKVLEELEARKLEQLREALPDLLALQKNPKDALVRIARGNDAVAHLRIRAFDELKAGDTYYIIGASGDRFYEVLGERHGVIEKRRIAKKIKKQLIAYESQRSLLEKNDPYRKYAEFRFLPLTYSVPSSTNIFGKTVAILIWTPEPIVITIESTEVAQSYRDYFSALWKLAKE
jgi:sugar-specific transcriptional regulator TrmB